MGSSKAWLARHVGDKYVKAAAAESLRSRSSFKLLEMNAKHRFLRPSSKVIDLGSAPGGWSQAMRDKIGVKHIVAVDLLDMEPIEGVAFIRGDFTNVETQQRVRELSPAIDVIVSDALMNTSGHRETDHARSMQLVEAILDFAVAAAAGSSSSSSSGRLPTLLAKYYRGGEERALLERCRALGWASVRSVKPDASRPESREMYLLAQTQQAAGGAPLKAKQQQQQQQQQPRGAEA